MNGLLGKYLKWRSRRPKCLSLGMMLTLTAVYASCSAWLFVNREAELGSHPDAVFAAFAGLVGYALGSGWERWLIYRKDRFPAGER